MNANWCSCLSSIVTIIGITRVVFADLERSEAALAAELPKAASVQECPELDGAFTPSTSFVLIPKLQLGN